MLKKLLPCDLTLDRIHHKIAKIEFLTFHKYHNAKVRYSWFFVELCADVIYRALCFPVICACGWKLRISLPTHACIL